MNIYDETCFFLEQHFRGIEKLCSKPDIVDRGNGSTLRYADHSVETAVVQLVARYVSALNASRNLLYMGFTQEMGALFRMLDETLEDAMFLVLSKNTGEHAERRSDYLADFFQEEFDDPKSAFRSSQTRKMVSRKKIQAAIADFGKDNLNPSDQQQNARTMSQAYSGYIHGTSVHIIEMIDGDEFEYQLNGLRNTIRQKQRGNEFWNYISRGIDLMILACSALRDQKLEDECRRFREYFELRTGQSSGDVDVKALIKKMKSS